MAVPTAFSPPFSLSSTSLFRSSSLTQNPSFSLFCIPLLFPSSSTPPRLLSRIRPVYCTTKKEANATAANGVDPKLGISVYKPRSYEVLVADAANALFYALNDGNKRLEIEFPPLPSNISSYKGSSDEFSDANIQLVLAVVKKLQEKMETRACIVFPDKPEKRRATELFKAAIDSVDALEAKLKELLAAKGESKDEATGSGTKTKDRGENSATTNKTENMLIQNRGTLLDMANNILETGRYGRQEFPDSAEDITKKVRIDVPDFDGRIDPKAFTDWFATLERFLDWFDMSNERRVRYAIMKLTGQAQIW